mgnify:FL=1
MAHTFACYFLHSFLLIVFLFSKTLSINTIQKNVNMYKVEGIIIFPSAMNNALRNTRILVNEGEFIGIPRIDGSFVIAG